MIAVSRKPFGLDLMTHAAPFHRASVQPSPMGVRDALESVTATLADAGYSLEERQSVELVLAEALNNVVEHAYGSSPAGGICLTILRGPRGLDFLVEDEGGPMPVQGLPAGRQISPGDALEMQPEGGFGWFIIHAIAHDIAYRRAEGGNELRFRMAVRL